MSFSRRLLSFTVQLGQGSFGNSGFTTVSVPTGLWATAKISKVGSPSYNEADIEIAGLPLDLMNQLSRIGLQAAAVRNNVVTVMAGDDPSQLSTVFAGVIREAWPDFSSPTEAIFKINANTGLLANMKTANPSSYTGSTDVETIMKTLAQQMGYKLENNGVSAKLSSPYLSGSARAQALSVADAADIYVYFEDDNGLMVICPKNGSRSTVAPTISPLEDMVGYPAYVGPGLVALSAEYNPQIRFLGNIVVQNSVVTGANGTWRVIDLKHDLSTRPDGPWFSHIRATNVSGATSS
jgi:hypothetical protein